MSKQFQAKKESLSYINKIYEDKPGQADWEGKYYELEEKFRILSERTKTLEKVYQFHKGIIQNISSGILTIDFDEKITFMNSAALRLVEYDYNELVGSSVRTIFADPQEAEAIITDLVNKRKMYESKEVSLLTRMQKIIPIGFTTTILDVSDPQFSGIIISFRDLTNLQNLRNQMERMDRLATLGEVSAGIAHEIRNPLAGIKTSAQVLEESFSPGDFRSQLVSRIVKEIDRSNELLKKFFKFAKPGKPRQEFVNIENIIKGVHLLLESKMNKKNIVLKTNFMDEVPHVYVDENQIEQVLINLLLNAMDAIESDGTIEVSTRTICEKDSEEVESLWVVVAVKDTGRGIAAENIEKIFNPFFTTKSEGVGLGLSISSRLIEENGGRIDVLSNLDKGARFSVYLPLR
jgi:PAS domain S-box-containing protein